MDVVLLVEGEVKGGFRNNPAKKTTKVGKEKKTDVGNPRGRGETDALKKRKRHSTECKFTEAPATQNVNEKKKKDNRPSSICNQKGTTCWRGSSRKKGIRLGF